MDLKPGYKQTEVGLIPEEWEVRPLADIAEIRSGIAKNSNQSVSKPVWVHYLRVANVQDGYLDLTEMSKIRVGRADIKCYAVLPGDVLMNEGGDLDKLGRGAVWRGEFYPCVHQNHVFVVRCGATLSPDYLNAWTGSAPARRYFMLAGKQTTNLASINKTALGQLPVAEPTVAEQEAIAEALSDADALIESLEQLLVKRRQLKQGAMQELLTGKKRLPGFEIKHGYKQTDVGVIPEDWEVRSLAKIAGIRSGIAKNSNRSVSNPVLVHYLRVANVQDGFLDLSEMSQILVSRNDINRYAVLPGDVLMNEGGDLDKLGRGALWRGEFSPCVHQNHVFVVRCGSTLSPAYLDAWTGAEPARRYFMLAGKQTTNLASINKTALGQLPIAVPPTIAEQEAIAAIFSDMDSEAAALEAKLAKTHSLKQGMMQELLTGRIRLI